MDVWGRTIVVSAEVAKPSACPPRSVLGLFDIVQQQKTWTCASSNQDIPKGLLGDLHYCYRNSMRCRNLLQELFPGCSISEEMAGGIVKTSSGTAKM